MFLFRLTLGFSSKVMPMLQQVSPSLGFRSAGRVTKLFHRPLSRHFQAPDLLHRLPSALAIEGARRLVGSRHIQLHACRSTRYRPPLGLVHHAPGQARATIRGVHIERDQFNPGVMAKQL